MGEGARLYTVPMDQPPTLRTLYAVLAATTEAGQWWPAEGCFEILVGAVLTQNTAWTNVERCIQNLKAAQVLNPTAIHDLPLTELQTLIRPSGYWRVKADYLKHSATWFIEYDPQASTMDDQALRRSLLAVHGIGDETADDILLYAYNRPVFIYDTYARRFLAAVGFGDYPTYRKAKVAVDPFVEGEGFDVEELAHFHGLIVQAGKAARAVGGWTSYWPELVSQASGQ